MSLTNTVLAESRRQTPSTPTSLQNRLMETRRISLKLAAPLSDEDQSREGKDREQQSRPEPP